MDSFHIGSGLFLAFRMSGSQAWTMDCAVIVGDARGTSRRAMVADSRRTEVLVEAT